MRKCARSHTVPVPPCPTALLSWSHSVQKKILPTSLAAQCSNVPKRSDGTYLQTPPSGREAPKPVWVLWLLSSCIMWNAGCSLAHLSLHTHPPVPINKWPGQLEVVPFPKTNRNSRSSRTGLAGCISCWYCTFSGQLIGEGEMQWAGINTLVTPPPPGSHGTR